MQLQIKVRRYQYQGKANTIIPILYLFFQGWLDHFIKSQMLYAMGAWRTERDGLEPPGPADTSRASPRPWERQLGLWCCPRATATLPRARSFFTALL